MAPEWITTEKRCRRAVTDAERAAAPGGRNLLGAYLIEGIRIHERAIRSGAPLRSVLVSASFLGDRSERAARLRGELERIDSLERCVAPDAEVERLTGGRGLGPLLGLVSLGEGADVGAIVRERGAAATFLVAYEVEDPGNVGALARTALAAGADALVAVGISDPYHPRAVRTSMGSIFRVPVARAPRGDALLDDLRSLGVLTVGAVTEGGTPLPETDRRGSPLALFVGREAFGLDGRTVKNLDRLVSIPMGSAVDSYSVNAAAAIALYELVARARFRK